MEAVKGAVDGSDGSRPPSPLTPLLPSFTPHHHPQQQQPVIVLLPPPPVSTAAPTAAPTAQEPSVALVKHRVAPGPKVMRRLLPAATATPLPLSPPAATATPIPTVNSTPTTSCLPSEPVSRAASRGLQVAPGAKVMQRLVPAATATPLPLSPPAASASATSCSPPPPPVSRPTAAAVRGVQAEEVMDPKVQEIMQRYKSIQPRTSILPTLPPQPPQHPLLQKPVQLPAPPVHSPSNPQRSLTAPTVFQVIPVMGRDGLVTHVPVFPFNSEFESVLPDALPAPCLVKEERDPLAMDEVELESWTKEEERFAPPVFHRAGDNVIKIQVPLGCAVEDEVVVKSEAEEWGEEGEDEEVDVEGGVEQGGFRSPSPRHGTRAVKQSEWGEETTLDGGDGMGGEREARIKEESPATLAGDAPEDNPLEDVCVGVDASEEADGCGEEDEPSPVVCCSKEEEEGEGESALEPHCMGRGREGQRRRRRGDVSVTSSPSYNLRSRKKVEEEEKQMTDSLSPYEEEEVEGEEEGEVGTEDGGGCYAKSIPCGKVLPVQRQQREEVGTMNFALPLSSFAPNATLALLPGLHPTSATNTTTTTAAAAAASLPTPPECERVTEETPASSPLLSKYRKIMPRPAALPLRTLSLALVAPAPFASLLHGHPPLAPAVTDAALTSPCQEPPAVHTEQQEQLLGGRGEVEEPEEEPEEEEEEEEERSERRRGWRQKKRKRRRQREALCESCGGSGLAFPPAAALLTRFRRRRVKKKKSGIASEEGRDDGEDVMETTVTTTTGGGSSSSSSGSSFVSSSSSSSLQQHRKEQEEERRRKRKRRRRRRRNWGTGGCSSSLLDAASSEWTVH